MAAAAGEGTSLAARLAGRANADGEFRLAARYWDGNVVFELGQNVLRFAVVDGVLAEGSAPSGRDIRLVATADVWAKVLAPVPPPYFNDLMPAAAFGMGIHAVPETLWQCYPAVRRLVDLLREEWR